jgi:hypothetical protein
MNAIDKLSGGFLWNNDETTSGAKCLVRWEGLRISDLEANGTALGIIWLGKAGLKWINHSSISAFHTWSHTCPLQCNNSIQPRGWEKISFWHDPWLDGISSASRATTLFKHGTKWNLTVRHFKRDFMQNTLHQFINIWETIADIHLHHDVLNTVTYRLTMDGT